MKKALAAVLFMCLALSALAGCGDDSKDETENKNSVANVSAATSSAEISKPASGDDIVYSEKLYNKLYEFNHNYFAGKDPEKIRDKINSYPDTKIISFDATTGKRSEAISRSGETLCYNYCSASISTTKKDLMKLLDDIQSDPEAGYLTDMTLKHDFSDSKTDPAAISKDEGLIFNFDLTAPYYEKTSEKAGNDVSMKNEVQSYKTIVSRFINIKLSSLIEKTIDDVCCNPNVLLSDVVSLGVKPEEETLYFTPNFYTNDSNELSALEKSISEAGYFNIEQTVPINIETITLESGYANALKAIITLSTGDKFKKEFPLGEKIINSVEKYGSLLK